jgi:sulfate adenylyltransferase
LIIENLLKRDVEYTDCKLIAPHGGKLREGYLAEPERSDYQRRLAGMPSWSLSLRQLCDLELLLSGGFSPLKGFMSQADYESVLSKMRLADTTLWPMPITLDVNQAFADKFKVGDEIALRDAEGVPLAVLKISDLWIPDKAVEAEAVFGTLDKSHPGVNYLFNQSGSIYIGGDVFGLTRLNHYDFNHLRHTPNEMRNLFISLGWSKIVAFQTRNPMHRAHVELTLRAAKEYQANILIHPSVGMTKPGDIDHYTRVRCYEKLLANYPSQSVYLSLLPLAMRMGGPREALWHAIIRKNYGCSHFIVGRDHAGPGKNAQGQDFYDPYAAQALVAQYQAELEIKMVPFQEMVYVRSKAAYYPINEVQDKQDILNISGTELRRCLQEGLEIPEWFSYPNIITELRRTHPNKEQQGFTLFFTGLSGAGKSTLANALQVKLMEIGGRPITLLDGDMVRQHLSSELGFSKAHRDINIQRIGYVASEITKHRGIAICAPIAPYQETRQKVRGMISAVGGFIEIYVNTPLATCESRDRKGLYAKARAGLIPEFTGISDPYEIPEKPELTLYTETTDININVDIILKHLYEAGFLKMASSA